MDTEPSRQLMSLAGISGALVWGLFHLVTMWRSGVQPSPRDVYAAVGNVIAALIVGGLVAYFVGPSLLPLVPVVGLRDTHVVGFGVGVLSWELLPVLFSFARSKAKRISRDKL